MKKIFFVLSFFLFCCIQSNAQFERHSVQFGISALPVKDIFNLYPKNAISGLATLGNVGYFPIKNLCVGINPYYSFIGNYYNDDVFPFGKTRVEEKIKLYGLNMYLRYYFFTKGKFSLYPSISAGFGNLQKTTLNKSKNVELSKNNYSSFIFYSGLGINYFLTSIISIDFNVHYVNVHVFSYDTDNAGFHTLAPTLGLQFFLK